MHTALALATFLAPIAWLGALHHFRWSSVLTPAHWHSMGKLLALGLVGLYLTAVLVLGTQEFQEQFRLSRLRDQSFLAAFLVPGISLGIVLFPQSSGEQSGHAAGLAQHQALSVYAVVGWAILVGWFAYAAVLWGR